ncbi:uncharacterized protein V2V93DRAFT_368889 [Kockiozyma suomiensis]|uniref:uncharacterized protein n=1 Tax=Kockiozyma suomiensis TaxID=1337062 RepID=UPI003343123F
MITRQANMDNNNTDAVQNRTRNRRSLLAIIRQPVYAFLVTVMSYTALYAQYPIYLIIHGTILRMVVYTLDFETIKASLYLLLQCIQQKLTSMGLGVFVEIIIAILAQIAADRLLNAIDRARLLDVLPDNPFRRILDLVPSIPGYSEIPGSLDPEIPGSPLPTLPTVTSVLLNMLRVVLWELARAYITIKLRSWIRQLPAVKSFREGAEKGSTNVDASEDTTHTEATAKANADGEGPADEFHMLPVEIDLLLQEATLRAAAQQQDTAKR